MKLKSPQTQRFSVVNDLRSFFHRPWAISRATISQDQHGRPVFQPTEQSSSDPFSFSNCQKIARNTCKSLEFQEKTSLRRGQTSWNDGFFGRTSRPPRSEKLVASHQQVKVATALVLWNACQACSASGDSKVQTWRNDEELSLIEAV